MSMTLGSAWDEGTGHVSLNVWSGKGTETENGADSEVVGDGWLSVVSGLGWMIFLVGKMMWDGVSAVKGMTVA